jgi:hypothetical protein
LQEEVGRKVAGGDWTRNLVKERCLTFPEPWGMVPWMLDDWCPGKQNNWVTKQTLYIRVIARGPLRGEYSHSDNNKLPSQSRRSTSPKSAKWTIKRFTNIPLLMIDCR